MGIFLRIDNQTIAVDKITKIEWYTNGVHIWLLGHPSFVRFEYNESKRNGYSVKSLRHFFPDEVAQFFDNQDFSGDMETEPFSQ